jgi:hypothetical protein
LKSLPSRALYGNTGCRGSNQIRSGVAGSDESEIRSSPVYAGHAIKPLAKRLVLPRAPAVLDRIEATRPKAERPLPDSAKTTGFPSFPATLADVLKGMISYRIGLSECEHGRASNGQHVR